MTKSTLVFAHGWGFDADFWKPVAERLPDFARVFVDFGFRHHLPHHPSVPGAIIVGHSMGFAWSLAHLPRPWAGAMSINGFPRFTRSSDFVAGVAPSSLDRMISRFAEDPAQVTRDFMARIGLDDVETDSLKTKPLADALDWLKGCDERQSMAQLGCPVAALAGTRDSLITEAMSRDSFPSQCLTLVDGGGHLLPLTHPDWVATQIRLFAQGLS